MITESNPHEELVLGRLARCAQLGAYLSTAGTGLTPSGVCERARQNYPHSLRTRSGLLSEAVARLAPTR